MIPHWLAIIVAGGSFYALWSTYRERPRRRGLLGCLGTAYVWACMVACWAVVLISIWELAK